MIRLSGLGRNGFMAMTVVTWVMIHGKRSMVFAPIEIANRQTEFLFFIDSGNETVIVIDYHSGRIVDVAKRVLRVIARNGFEFTEFFYG